MKTKNIFNIGFTFLLVVIMSAVAFGGATGGTITKDGDYAVHIFNANGSFIITAPILNASILIVGGGGGAAYGGGGAGGVNYLTGINITTNQSVIVGVGGLGSPNCDSKQGSDGSSSLFMGYNGTGGGAGGKNSNTGNFGGSGGGGAGSGGGAGISGQGNNGGSGTGWGSPYCGGSGGGAGQAGLNTAGSARSGGNGTAINITGTLSYYGGGGASGCNSGGSTASGGLGGGGSGVGGGLPGGNGVNGTGGGGGGSGSSMAGGRGGNGIVIIRYLNVSINPSINYTSQSPVNFTIANTITQISNITFNIVDMNLTTIRLFVSTNSTANNIKDITAGTPSYNPTELSCLNISTTQIRCGIQDNIILRGVYNYNQSAMQNSLLTSLKSFNNANDRLRQQFQSNDFNYTFIFVEYNCNGSTGANMEIWYYNSSLSSVLIGTTPANSPFNHRHSSTSAHHYLGLAYNTTDKTLNGIKATNPFYIEIRGTSGATFNCYGLSGVSGVDTLQQSINGGASYTSIIATSDIHIHAFNVNTTFSYIASGVGLDGLNYSSVRQNDLLETFALPPTAPLIDFVLTMDQNTTQNISWVVSYSPQFTPILNYRMSLHYANLSLVRNISTISGASNSYNYNGTDPLGEYVLGLYATDTDGLTSGTYYSNPFNITEPCISNFACTDFGVCTASNISLCYVVTDIACGQIFEGNTSDYDTACVYVPITSVNWLNFDLANSNNAFIFGIFVFLWLGLAVITFVFRNIYIAGMMFIVGVGLGFMVVSVSMVLSLMFLFMSTMLFMKFNGGD